MPSVYIYIYYAHQATKSFFLYNMNLFPCYYIVGKLLGIISQPSLSL